MHQNVFAARGGEGSTLLGPPNWINEGPWGGVKPPLEVWLQVCYTYFDGLLQIWFYQYESRTWPSRTYCQGYEQAELYSSPFCHRGYDTHTHTHTHTCIQQKHSYFIIHFIQQICHRTRAMLNHAGKVGNGYTAAFWRRLDTPALKVHVGVGLSELISMNPYRSLSV